MKRRELILKASLGLIGILLTPVNSRLDSKATLAENLYLSNRDLKKTELIVEKLKENDALRQIKQALGLDTIIKADLEKYNGLVQYALAESEKKKVILINKSKYSLDLLQNGKKLKQYPIELGFNPVDDKQMEGDFCTPEGIYPAIKLPPSESNYHRAILIDYPSFENRLSFHAKQKSGILPNDATIGGKIEIHGNGSGKKGNEEGRNWTLGCVALSDRDIESLYDSVTTGTPIVIVKYTTTSYK